MSLTGETSAGAKRSSKSPVRALHSGEIAANTSALKSRSLSILRFVGRRFTAATNALTDGSSQPPPAPASIAGISVLYPLPSRRTSFSLHVRQQPRQPASALAGVVSRRLLPERLPGWAVPPSSREPSGSFSKARSMTEMWTSWPSAWESDRGIFAACLCSISAHRQSRLPRLNVSIWPENCLMSHDCQLLKSHTMPASRASANSIMRYFYRPASHPARFVV